MTWGPLDAGQSRTARLAAALVARHDFTVAVRLLNGVGILPMPLKGVLLQHVVYQDPADRVLSDTDLLVPPGRFREAIAALRAAGHSIDPEGRAGCSTRAPGAGLQVDVHRRPFSPGLYDLDGGAMFARGTIDEKLFGAVVVIPAPEDLFAHLVGNFAKGRHNATTPEQVRDFSAVASRFGLAARPLARHLEQHGLARAARYALIHADDAFSIKLLRALRPDPVGAVSASVARRLTARFGVDSNVSALAPHLVNRTLPRGVVSAGAHAALGLRARLAARLR
ncbi:MAG: nucleotidyltransferase family protein [Sandaracinaceae bacterium]|nr:nucleotidyltransferase family protein [Sandaracinaceae bacterium]